MGETKPLTFSHCSPNELNSAALVAIPFFEDLAFADPSAEKIDALTKHSVSSIVEQEQFKGKKGESLLIYTSDAPFQRVFLVGCGKSADADNVIAFQLAAQVFDEANKRKLDSATLLIDGPSATGLSLAAMVEGAELANYKYDKYLSQAKPRTCDVFTFATHAFDAAVVKHHQMICEGVKIARFLVNGPPTEIYPESMAEHARAIASECGLDIVVFDEKELAQKGMNLINAVGGGSARPPRLIHLPF